MEEKERGDGYMRVTMLENDYMFAIIKVRKVHIPEGYGYVVIDKLKEFKVLLRVYGFKHFFDLGDEYVQIIPDIHSVVSYYKKNKKNKRGEINGIE